MEPKNGDKGVLYVFDFEKAERLIAEYRPDYAEAGLQGDWDNTADVIELTDGEWKIGKAYLQSCSHYPILRLSRNDPGGWHCTKFIECWQAKPAVYQDCWRLADESGRVGK